MKAASLLKKKDNKYVLGFCGVYYLYCTLMIARKKFSKSINPNNTTTPLNIQETDPKESKKLKLFIDKSRIKGIAHILTMTKGMNILLGKFKHKDASKLKFILSVFSLTFISTSVFQKNFSTSISLYLFLRFIVRNARFFNPRRRFTCLIGPRPNWAGKCSFR